MLEAAVAQYRRQQQLATSALVASRGAWRLLDQHALDATVGRYLSRMVPVLSAAQLAAASSGGAYVGAALAEQGIEASPAGEVQPQTLAGLASDGRRLDSLLRAPVGTVKALSAAGTSVAEAMRSGQARLERIVTTQVADAARVATGVGVAATPGISYVRMLNPPSCARCAILAGRVYEYNAGFLRHPQCDCIHVPTNAEAAVAEGLFDDPRAYFDSLSEAEQDRIFTKAGAQAIRDGADMSQVVNARRGMYTADGRLLTRESTTRRGAARPGRLMPEEIYRRAGSREEAIRLLTEHGYLRQPGRSVTAAGVETPQLRVARVGDLTDTELDELFADLSALPDLDPMDLQRVADEMDRREESARRVAAIQQEDWLQDASPGESYGWPEPDELTLEQRRLDDLIDRGWSYIDAYAEVYGADAARLSQQGLASLVRRRAGETIDQAVSRAYDEWVHLEYVRAEEYARGHLLNTEGQAAGIDPRELFSGQTSRARRYASEDLLRYWTDESQRLTKTQFRAQVLGRESDIAAAEATRFMSQGEDFI